MNRRITIEAIPDGRLVVSTNFASGRPEADMSVAIISENAFEMTHDIRSLLEDEPDDPFRQGMRRMENAAWLARRNARLDAPGDADDIPF